MTGAAGDGPAVVDRRTVLVVDDDPDVLLLCRVQLEFEGYRVLAATDDAEAVAIVADVVPDVVLLDVAIAKLDGWAVLEAIGADPRTAGVPVVMLMSEVQDGDQVRGWVARAAEHITAPFDPVALARVVEDVLRTDHEEVEQRRRLALDH